MEITEKQSQRAFFTCFKRADQRFHLTGIEPQSVPGRTAVQLYQGRSLDLDNLQLAVATRATPLPVPRAPCSIQHARYLARGRSGPTGDQLQLPGIQPNPATIDTAIDLDAIEFESNQWFMA